MEGAKLMNSGAIQKVKVNVSVTQLISTNNKIKLHFIKNKLLVIILLRFLYNVTTHYPHVRY